MEEFDKNQYYIMERNQLDSQNDTNDFNNDDIELLKTEESIDEKNIDEKNIDEKSIDELNLLLKQTKSINENFKNELNEYLEEVKNNINIFSTWFKSSLLDENILDGFNNNFLLEYRIQLFEQICQFFQNESIVTDQVLFYWKYIVISYLRNSKKYKHCLEDLEIDLINQTTNLRMVKQKSIFRCFIDDEPICYFKENGNEYYTS